MAVPLASLRELGILSVLRGHTTMFLASPTPEQLSKINFNDKSSLEPLVVAVASVCMTLIASVVGLRLFVRRFITGRLFVDDYLVIIASVFTVVTCACVIAATRYGLGKHIWNLDRTDILGTLKSCIQIMFVMNIFYAAAIAFTKMSIIASYVHIFDPRGLVKVLLQTTACITIGLGIASIPATIFECYPVDGAWNLDDSHAKCYPFVHFLYASTALSVLTDVALCIVPIPLFWRLQLPRRQKIMVSCLFFLGGFACIASIIRLAYLHLLRNPFDITYDLVSSVMWTIAESTIGIVCVSLPPLRSLLARFLPSLFRGSSQPSGSKPSGAGPARPSPSHGASEYATSSDGGKGTRLSSRVTDIIVLSSLATRHSVYSSNSTDAFNVPANEGDYRNRPAKQLGVSVHISAADHGADSHRSIGTTSSGGHSQDMPHPAQHDVEMGVDWSVAPVRPAPAWDGQH